MLPSERRAQVAEGKVHDFDTSYLSRKALAGDMSSRVETAANKSLGSTNSRTTAGLTTLDSGDQDPDDEGDLATPSSVKVSAAKSIRGLSPVSFRHAASGSWGSDSDSDFSDEDSSTRSSRESTYTASTKRTSRHDASSNSLAGTVWRQLDQLDDLVLDVKVN